MNHCKSTLVACCCCSRLYKMQWTRWTMKVVRAFRTQSSWCRQWPRTCSSGNVICQGSPTQTQMTYWCLLLIRKLMMWQWCSRSVNRQMRVRNRCLRLMWWSVISCQVAAANQINLIDMCILNFKENEEERWLTGWETLHGLNDKRHPQLWGYVLVHQRVHCQ